MQCQWKDKVLTITGPEFEKLALELFLFQYQNNEVYQQYVKAVQVDPDSIQSVSQIPFLPIRFFKSHTIKTTAFDNSVVF